MMQTLFDLETAAPGGNLVFSRGNLYFCFDFKWNINHVIINYMDTHFITFQRPTIKHIYCIVLYISLLSTKVEMFLWLKGTSRFDHTYKKEQTNQIKADLRIVTFMFLTFAVHTMHCRSLTGTQSNLLFPLFSKNIFLLFYRQRANLLKYLMLVLKQIKCRYTDPGKGTVQHGH